MEFIDKIKNNEKQAIEKIAHLLEIEQGGQRSDEWFKARMGRFTGSKISDLMSCGRSTSKLEWGRPEKMVDIGDMAKKYIFSRAKERQRNKVVKIQSSVAMKYGTEQEEFVKELLLQFDPRIKEIIDVDFIEFIKGVAGASPDGYVIFNDGEIMNLEIKCAADWGGVYDRHEIPFDQKNKDFWQINAEMLALSVHLNQEIKKTLYVVAEPSENIFEPNITDLSSKIVDASPIHQQCIIQRCKLGDAIVNNWLHCGNMERAVERATYEFSTNQK